MEKGRQLWLDTQSPPVFIGSVTYTWLIQRAAPDHLGQVSDAEEGPRDWWFVVFMRFLRGPI